MATSNVELRVDARQAVTALQQVNQASGQASAATDKLKNAATSAGSALSGTGQSASRAVSGVNSLISSIGKLTTAYLGLRTAQQAVQAGIQREESERRLTFLARGYNEVAQAQAAATRTGKQFGLSATESNQQFAQLYGRLRPLNVSLQDIESAFVGFNTAAKVSGATSAESAGALLQLTQALGSGVLRGQELNSVLEQAPGLVVALTRELGRPISEIRTLAEEGQITSEVVIRALKRAATDGADQLSEAMQGPAQQVKNLQNAFEDLQVAATDDLLPAIIQAIKGLKELLISLGPIIRGLGGIAKQTLGTVADLINAATKPRAFAAAQAIRGGRLPLAGLGGMSGAEELFKGTSGAGGVGLTGLKKEAADLARLRRQPVSSVLLELMQARLARMEAPATTTGGGGGGDSMLTGDGLTAKERRKREREAERARRLAEKNAQMVAESGRALDVSRQDFVIQQRLLTAQKNKNEALVITREAQQELLAINAKGAEILANKEIPAQAKLNQIESLRFEAKKVSLQLAYDLANLEEEQRKKIEEQVKLGQERQQSLADEFALLQAKINGNEAEVILQQQLRDITKDTAGLDAKAVEDQLRKIQTLKDQVRIQEQIKAVYTDIGMSIKSGITDAIQGAIDGTKTLGDVANQVLRTIGNKLLDVAVNMALFGEMSGTGKGGGLLGSLFKPRANGGSVMAGQSYLVGERGPELFTPGRSGGIAPSGGFGAVNVVVNVDASGGNVQGGGALGAAMGRVVTAAVQAELIKQKRAGGILS